ncbi:endo-1,4-beta-xylanase [Mongoliitalea daihaiensis]|uniref:endo-1,4-beta-xylanase n=1 Tax=Mongoliitalea daihaiensis TaxID=2782006 RepID=UPI001F3C2FFD|nr:endo-1,4-beta-xylanase [Mongoliitalea daihaiensis]UJP65081.1 endo-1,4-beta-xylanase [Mongoliitalea daihaiensis]
MKKIIYSIGVLGLLSLASCADFGALDDFQVEKPLSVEMQEEINSFGDLLDYVEELNNPNFRVGISLPMSDYTNQGVRFRLINRNFNEFSPSSGMDHRTVVQNNGNLNLVQVQALLEMADSREINVFGSPLVWHRNQNASFLNSQLSPLIVNSPAFMNELNVSELSGGNLDNWASSQGVTFEPNQGMGAGTPAVKLSAGMAVSSPSDVSFSSPSINIIPGRTYEVIAYIKSDQPGEGRFTFEGLSNNEPALAWGGSGAATETFTTSISWKEIRFRVSDFTGESFRFNLELGYESGVNYFLDINNLYVYDLEGDPVINNLISGGDFDGGIAWGGWGNNSVRGVTEEGMGVGNEGRAFFVTNPSLTGGFWEVQTLYQLAAPVNNGETYRLSFWVRGDAEGVIRPELQSPNFSSNGFGQVFVTPEWRFVSVTTTATADDRNRFIISYGEFAGTVYIDQVVLSSEAFTGGSTTIVEKTEVEKTSIISTQMERYISQFVGETKGQITERVVVAEPIHESNTSLIRTGVGLTPGEGEFYWQDYIGKDYGVEAFKLARQFGNSGDVLYISESGMEANLAKCEALIDYVSYIEQNGGQVDGIAARMVLNLNSNMENVAQMFRLLAATGKKVKISALEVRLNDANPSVVALITQGEAYKQVISLYLDLIPSNQQAGITFAAPIDGTDSARSGLWTSGLVRKHAYAGIAEGFQR